MKLTFLGSGSAFFPPWEGNYQSNMLLETVDKRRLMIDCGTHAAQSLHDAGLTVFDLDAFYVSHQHADHIGGLEEVAFKTYFSRLATLRQKYNLPQEDMVDLMQMFADSGEVPMKTLKPKLFANGSMLNYIWAESLKGGLASIQGKVVTLGDYFELVGVPRNGSFTWEGVEFRLIRTIHIMDGYDFVPSYGLMFEVNGKTIFITTDSQHCPNQIMDFYQMADIIFQDCETTPFKSGVHAHFSDLSTLPAEIKAKMWLYHFNPGEKPDAVAAGFAGYVQKGQVFDL
jgi:ribonuclease BN (tRNA processing enzyme)